MASKTLLIDGNSLGYSAQQTTRLTCGGMETQAAYGMIRSMRELRKEHPSFTPFVLWDGRAEWRFALHPGYKGTRNEKADAEKVAMKAAYAEQRPYIERLITHLGVRQLTAYKQEADDMAGYFVAKLAADPESEIGLITGDGDWAQLVRKNVWWKDHRDDARYIDYKNFYDKTGCRTPLEYLETKILTGDSSDCISGVGGIGATGAPQFIAEFGSMREFWRRCASGEHTPKGKVQTRLLGACEHDLEAWTAQYPGDPADAKALKKHVDAWPGQGRLLYKRNFQLMQLLRVPAPEKKDLSIIVGKPDKEAFAAVCEELAFVSILRNMDEFFKPFEQ